MTNEFKNIDQLFRKVTEGASKTPPPHIWGKLNNSLDKALYFRKIRIVWMAAASFALLVAFASGYYIAFRFSQKKEFTSQKISEKAVSASSDRISATSSLQQNFSEKTDIQAPVVSQPVQPVKTIKSKQQEIIITTREEITENTNQDVPPVIVVSERVIQNEPEIKYIPEDSIKEPDNQAIYEKEISPQKKSLKGKFRIMAYASPSLAYRSVSNSGSNLYPLYNAADYSLAENSVRDDKFYYNTIEKPLFMVSGGLGMDYHLSTHLSLSAGIFYGKYGQKIREIFIYEDEMKQVNSIINSSAGDISLLTSGRELKDQLNEPAYLVEEDPYGTSIYMSPSSLSIRLSFLEIPVSVKYFFSSNTNGFYGHFGFAPAFLTENKAMLYNDQMHQLGSTTQIRSINVTSFAGIGFSYGLLNEKIRLMIEPQFRFMIRAVSDIGYIHHNPYALMFNSGLSYTF